MYDGDGQRVLRQDSSGMTAYLGAVEVHITDMQRLTKTYYFAPSAGFAKHPFGTGQVGGQRVAMREGVTVTYLHNDHLGSASLATDASGVQVSAMRYMPFGETRYGDAPSDFRFTGQRQGGFGLYDYGARFYSPGVGRFVSADTIVPEPNDPQSWNRYSYVNNNPLWFTLGLGVMR